MGGYGDVLGGGMLVALGVFGGIYTYAYYPLGTLRQMGPGMVPMILSVTLTGLGASIAARGLLTLDSPLRLDFKAAGLVAIGVALFALLVERVGAVPAVFALTFVSFAADSRGTLWGILITATMLCLAITFIFVVGLRMPIDLFRWPF